MTNGHGLPTALNVVLQAAAVVIAAVLRAHRPGEVTTAVVVTVGGLLIVLVPVALAVLTLRSRRLPAHVAVPFVACAIGLIVMAGLVPDVDAAGRFVPLLDVFGVHHPRGAARMGPTGALVGLGYLVAVGWTVVAVALERRRRPNHGESPVS